MVFGTTDTNSELYTATRARPLVAIQRSCVERNLLSTNSVMSDGNALNNPASSTAPSAPASWEKYTSAGDASPSVMSNAASSPESA